jgi:hypothetical protein
MKVFGVGCVYFGYPEQNFTKREESSYMEDILSALSGVESLSNLKVEGSIVYGGYAVFEETEGSIVVPLLYGATLSFDLFLPFRIQESIHSSCDVEMIHVDIIWGYDAPILFASYEWPEEEGDASPSSAVIVIRKYLEKKLTNKEFSCGCVGPSPFHANFTVVPSKIDEGISLVDVSDSLIGYYSVELRIPPGEKFMDAISSSKIESFFSLYYYLCELRKCAIRKHAIIIEDAKTLLSQGSENPWFKRLIATFNQSKIIDRINSEIINEMLIRMEMSQQLDSGDSDNRLAVGSDFSKLFTEFKSMVSEESWGKFSEVAKFFEERRQRIIGNFAGLISGLMGGIVGALIGSLATYYLTQNSRPQPAAVEHSQATEPSPVATPTDKSTQPILPMKKRERP